MDPKYLVHQQDIPGADLCKNKADTNCGQNEDEGLLCKYFY